MNYRPRASPGQGISIKLQDRRALLADRSLRKLQSRHRRANPPALSPRISQSETPALDFTACRLRFPRVAMELAVMPFRSSGGDSEKLAPRWRDCAGKRSDPAKF